MTLRVLDPGLYSTVVDFGRPSSRSLGVPVGGAADCFALCLGNALVGNPPNTPALEVTLAGPTLEAGCELACVLYGASFDLAGGRQRLRVGTTFTLHAGEHLHIGAASQGVRAYLCVRGGFEMKEVLGSQSALEPLAAGQELQCRPGAIHGRFVHLAPGWNHEPGTLRVLEAPQAGWFTASEFYGQSYTVTPSSNRMGLRLRGRPLRVPERELTSEPVCPGSVQVTRDGQCIVLGVDGQTIGGYPKIAQVISADVDKLAQLRPGEAIRFTPVSLEAAEAIYHHKRALLREWVTRLLTAEVFLGEPQKRGDRE
jgi:antagonist of KipI